MIILALLVACVALAGIISALLTWWVLRMRMGGNLIVFGVFVGGCCGAGWGFYIGWFGGFSLFLIGSLLDPSASSPDATAGITFAVVLAPVNCLLGIVTGAILGWWESGRRRLSNPKSGVDSTR